MENNIESQISKAFWEIALKRKLSEAKLRYQNSKNEVISQEKEISNYWQTQFQMVCILTNLITYQAIKLKQKQYHLINAYQRQTQTRGGGQAIAKGAITNILNAEEGQILSKEQTPTFKEGETHTFIVPNPHEEAYYFAFIEISNGIATFVYPYHQSLDGLDYDITDAQNFKLEPDEAMPLDISITKGIYDVEILYSNQPFDFRLRPTNGAIPIADYQVWKQTHADKIAFVKDGMRYIGE